MHLLEHTEHLKRHITKFEEDNVASDLGIDDYLYERRYNNGPEFTPYTGHFLTSQGESVNQTQGEQEDLTACDKECGFCGCCSY